MKIELEIPAEIIANMMTSAIESGDPVTTGIKGGWCDGIYWLNARHQRVTTRGEPWYAEKTIYEGRFLLEIAEIVDEAKFHPNKRQAANIKAGAVVLHKVDARQFKRGFEIMARTFPDHFAQVMADNTDAPCADIFLQCVLFGEEKYA